MTVLYKISITNLIVLFIFLFRMLPAIHFDNQLPFHANKINNIWTERNLAAKLTIVQPPGA